MFHFRTVFATRRALIGTAIASTLLAISPVPAAAGEWPDGNVQLIVPAKPGGGTDALARVIAGGLAEQTGGNFVVVNNPGGGGAVAAEQIRTTDPDGSELLLYHSGFLSTYHTGGYNHSPVDDFTLIADLPVGGSYALAVHAESDFQTMDDLIKAATDAPDTITLGVQIRGSTHFMAGLISTGNDAAFRIVEAGSDADKLVQLQGRQIDAALINTPGTLQYVESGDLRILATIAGTPDRDPNAPDFPSASELGYTDAVFGLDLLVLGPLGMDAALVATVHDAIEAVVTDPDISEKLKSMRFPVSSLSVDEGRTRIQATDARIGATAKMLGLSQ